MTIDRERLIASDEQHSVREFVQHAFRVAGIEIEWRGSGPNEVAVAIAGTLSGQSAKGRTLVRIVVADQSAREAPQDRRGWPFGRTRLPHSPDQPVCDEHDLPTRDLGARVAQPVLVFVRPPER